jgi:diguanylate cyclase
MMACKPRTVLHCSKIFSASAVNAAFTFFVVFLALSLTALKLCSFHSARRYLRGKRSSVETPQPTDADIQLPSAASKALQYSLMMTLLHGAGLIVMAALWQRYMPIADPMLRMLSSLLLLVFPLAYLAVSVPKFARTQVGKLMKSVEVIEHIAVGRLDIILPPAQIAEAVRMNSALSVMMRRMRASLTQLERAAQEDALTQLCNRPFFKSKVEYQLQSGQACTLFLLDLDGFKAVNDSIGHSGGDRLLTLFAERARVVLAKYAAGRASDQQPIMARLGGDEFAICLVDITDTAAISHVAQRLIKAVEEPFNIEGASVSVSVSIGIALAPQDGGNYELLSRNADLALFQAKHLGKRNHQFFNESLKRQALAKRTIEAQLREAIASNAFEVYYQPQPCARTQVVVGAEALVRWQHPTLGLLLPDKFISVAEEFGLISDIGRIVLRHSIAQAALWAKQGRPLRVSVNIAAIQLRQADFVTHIRGLLNEFDLPAWLLELELTETTAMQDSQDVYQLLADVRALGVSLAVDDFGTGYSNLSLLRRLEFDRLKIDRSFISGIETQEDARMIVSTILAMANAMDVEVVAEGIETQRQATILTAAGCTLLQGNLFSKPICVAEFETWWEAQVATSSAASLQSQVA